MLNEVDVGNANEPAEIRGLSKCKLYKLLSNTYMLPCKESRGVTREYLVEVYRNTVFRVNRNEIQQFEANLMLDEQLKNSFFNLGVVMDRLALLMNILHFLPLGFNDHVKPDEAWISRVARFVDPFNILRVFRRRVRNAARPAITAARV